MFKSIKEFFVGKPKVEEPVITITDPAIQTTTLTAAAAQPVIEEIKPETITVSISDNMNVSVGSQPDTITTTSSATWPFPTARPQEPVVKKTRTAAKRQEPVTEKKPVPTIKAKTKPRKKK